MDISCKDYTAPVVIGFTTSKVVVAVNLTGCRIVTSTVITSTSGYPSTEKAGTHVKVIIT